MVSVKETEARQEIKRDNLSDEVASREKQIAALRIHTETILSAARERERKLIAEVKASQGDYKALFLLKTEEKKSLDTKSVQSFKGELTRTYVC